MTDDTRFNEELQRMIRDLEPPPIPREEMWGRIQAERAVRRSHAVTASSDVLPLRRRVIRPALQWSAALAAMLVVGIGLGRLSMRQATSPEPAVPVASTTPPTGETPPDAVPAPYRLAATQHLQRTEVLLTSLSIDVASTQVGEVSTWARELLTETRLLLASPAARDPALLALLEDLELVLAQLSVIPTARAREEVELIQDGINQSDVLLRLRAVTTGPKLVGT